jgi:hypothetical protein
MSLNFLQPFLDSRVTFTRGSNATLVDSTGRITYAPANLLLQSQTFDNASWTKITSGTGVVPVVTANFAVAPDGTMTADRVQLNAGTNGSSDYSLLRQAGPYPVPFIRSIWVKSNTGVAQEVALVATSSVSKITVPVEWTRVSQLQSSIGALQFDVSVGGTASTPATADILVWGAQLEPVTYQTTAGTYVATTTAAYYGPRFDYDPVTLAPKGILIEEQRVNLVLRSEEFDNASWVKSTATVTADTTVSPDGTADADTLTSSSTSGVVERFVGFTGDGAKSVSVFLKAGTSGTTIFFLRDATALVTRGSATITWTGGVPSAVASSGGTIEAVENYGNGWYRIKLLLAGVIAANSNSLRIQPDSVAGTGTVIAWGAQAENGSFATSYIPTVASTVTRSADVATMTGTNFSSWYNASEGTFVTSADTLTTSAATRSIFDVRSATTIRMSLSNFGTSASFAVVDTTTQAFLEGTTAVAENTFFQIAGAYKANDFGCSANGGAAVTDTSGTVPAANIAWIGGVNGTSVLNGHIRSIAYYNTRLPNAQLQALTAPPLITTLSLDFINGIYEG